MHATTLLAGALCAPFVSPTVGVPSDKPDVVVVFWDDVSLFDVQELSTPNFDQLAAGAVQFTRCYGSPICAPSRRQLFTGNWTRRSSGSTCIDGGGSLTFANGQYSLSRMVAGTGAQLAGFGKWHLGSTTVPGMPWETSALLHGFSTWRAGIPRNVKDCSGDSYTNWLRWEDGVAFMESRHQTEVLMEEFEAWWTAAPTNTPRVAYVSFQQAHEPFHAPPVSLMPGGVACGSTTPKQQYRCMVRSLDELLGRILQLVPLDAVVIVTADNGTPEQNLPRRVSGKGKGTTYERGVRVPLVIRAPDCIGGLVVDELVSLVDVLGTVGDYLGACPPPNAEVASRTLRPLVNGRRTTHRNHVFVGADKYMSSMLTGNDRAVILRDDEGLWKYREVDHGATKEYFHLTSDPFEELPDATGAPKARLEALLDEFDD